MGWVPCLFRRKIGSSYRGPAEAMLCPLHLGSGLIWSKDLCWSNLVAFIPWDHPGLGWALSEFTFTFHCHALEKEMATHSSVLAWRTPGMGEPGGLLSMGSHRVGHDWSDLAAAARLRWKTQQWTQDWKMSVFIPIPKKSNAKECSNYHTIVLISHASKVMLKILQTRLQQYTNWELSDVQAGFRKGRGTRDQMLTSDES